jgi:hypothetical protein
MGTRSPTHAKDEKAIFEAFLSGYPTFRCGGEEVEQPDDEVPDVIVTTTGGGAVDFELAEWLHGPQMAEAVFVLGVAAMGSHASRVFKELSSLWVQDARPCGSPSVDCGDRAVFASEAR